MYKRDYSYYQIVERKQKKCCCKWRYKKRVDVILLRDIKELF